MSPHRLVRLAFPAALAAAAFAALPRTGAAQTGSADAASAADSSLLTLDRLFASYEFAPDNLGAVRWIPGEAAYTKLERDSTTPPARALVRYDAATGRRDVW